MRFLQFIVTFILAVLLLGCSRTDIHDIQGNSIRLADYQGQWIIVNYWADWCKPCLTELPELNSLYLQNKNKVIVFGVNYDQLSDKAVQTFANKLNIQFPLLRSFPAEKFGIKEISTIPLTIIISPEGKLTKILQGPQTRVALERAIINQKMP